jgi:CheY-like chemotaxis protein
MQFKDESQPAAGDPPPANPSRRVLVVDDNRDSANSLALLFRCLGNHVRTAFDGRAALVEARAFMPEIVLLDIGMPGMNGYDVARAIRAEPQLRDAVLVAQTGWGQDEDRRKSHEAGFDGHLVKPIDFKAMQTLIAAALAERQSL